MDDSRFNVLTKHLGPRRAAASLPARGRRSLRSSRAMPHGKLAAMQEMAGTTLSRNLKPLACDGLVRIQPGEDRRTRYVTITETGEAVLEEARPLWRPVQGRVVAEVGEERVERLLGELSEVLGQFRAADSRAGDHSRW